MFQRVDVLKLEKRCLFCEEGEYMPSLVLTLECVKRYEN
ncbi:hypothetical protein MSWAN_1171 [Methanobacterium paludis]|uniref:Uncharacterized protein n=1 Tax=Methanobacterium paludis (strain DSM 25820 / JCM 18151 / SWAN1) TaxID=868131 RepID=F6D580_METPW|nr:hypothetical protein MSWAN_1171 [Methanobacterium paludis]